MSQETIKIQKYNFPSFVCNQTFFNSGQFPDGKLCLQDDLPKQSFCLRVASIYANLLEQKKVLTYEKSSSPIGLVWYTKMATPSSPRNTIAGVGMVQRTVSRNQQRVGTLSLSTIWMPGAGWEHLYGYHDVMKIIYTSTMYLQLAFDIPHPTAVGQGS